MRAWFEASAQPASEPVYTEHKDRWKGHWHLCNVGVEKTVGNPSDYFIYLKCHYYETPPRCKKIYVYGEFF